MTSITRCAGPWLQCDHDSKASPQTPCSSPARNSNKGHILCSCDKSAWRVAPSRSMVCMGMDFIIHTNLSDSPCRTSWKKPLNSRSRQGSAGATNARWRLGEAAGPFPNRTGLPAHRGADRWWSHRGREEREETHCGRRMRLCYKSVPKRLVKHDEPVGVVAQLEVALTLPPQGEVAEVIVSELFFCASLGSCPAKSRSACLIFRGLFHRSAQRLNEPSIDIPAADVKEQVPWVFLCLRPWKQMKWRRPFASSSRTMSLGCKKQLKRTVRPRKCATSLCLGHQGCGLRWRRILSRFTRVFVPA